MLIYVDSYESKESMSQHNKEPHFKELFATLTENNLMAKQPTLIHTVNKGGFDKDRQLIDSKL